MEVSPFITRQKIFNKERVVTNRITLQVFIFCFVMWLVTLIYAFCFTDSSEKKNNNFMENLMLSFSSVFFWNILVVWALIIVLLLAMRYIPNFSYVIFVTFWIPMIINTSIFTGHPSFLTFLLVAGSYLSCGFTLYLLKTGWIHLPERILKESCKVLILFKSSIIFMILQNFLCIFIVFVMIKASMSFATFQFWYTWKILLVFLNIFVSMWTILIISCIGFMTLSGVYATWFWSDNKSEISCGTAILLRSLTSMCIYHVGTAAYATSPMGLLNTFYQIIVHTGKKYKDSTNGCFLWFVIYNFFDFISMRIAFLGALIKCATNGTNYQVSADDALTYFRNHSKRCLVVAKVLEYVIVFIILILSIPVVCIFIKTYYIKIDEISFHVAGCLESVLPVFGMLITAAYTILFCVIEDISIHDGSQERPYATSKKLQNAINCDRPSIYGKVWLMACGLAQIWFLFIRLPQQPI